MKTVKVTVIDTRTLEILEEANKGDRIDLNSIHDIDIDSSEIDKLISNVTNEEFLKRLEKETKLLEQKKELEFKDILNKKQEELNNQIKNLELEKSKLEESIKSSSETTALTIQKEVVNKEKELLEKNNIVITDLKEQIANLKNELANKEEKQKDILEVETLKSSNLLKEKIAEKEKELQKLEAEKKDNTYDLQSKIKELENELIAEKKEKSMQLENEKQKIVIEYTKKLEEKDSDIKTKENEIRLLNEFKFKQSTKMIGENLEQHFKSVWEQTGKFMFPNATFEKDNQISEDGTKGDFIYREVDENNIEILSIMFEMKNEADATATKHKNADFYAKLDKDRKLKSCEYAILASLLEKEVDYFNDIYTVNPKEYEKMYVIRPQHFITLINFLRQGNLTAQQYKLELNNIRKNEIDVTNFENNLRLFQEGFSKNYDSASKNFSNAIDEIDKSINHLQKIKEALTTSDNQLRLANKKSEELTIKKLTNNAPSIRQMFEKAAKTNNDPKELNLSSTPILKANNENKKEEDLIKNNEKIVEGNTLENDLFGFIDSMDEVK